MRARLIVAFVVGLASFGCGGEERSTPLSTEPVGEQPADTSPADPPPSTTAPVDDDAVSPPSSYLRFGAEGLVRVTGVAEEQLADGPIRLATSDGAGGVLYSEWTADDLQGATWWLEAGADVATVVADSILGIPARLDERSVVVGTFPTDDCEEEPVDSMIARDLASGSDTVLQCATGGSDDGWGPNSFGGGLYVGGHWSAVIDRGALMSSIDLVFRNELGEVVDHPANPYDDDCHPCELTAALSPDGTRLAVLYRPDALQFRNENWQAETAAIPAQVQVFDLTSGEMVFDREVLAGAQPRWAWHPWFDGRYVVLGPDRFEHPFLALDDRGPAVSTLQQLLVDDGADIEVDGIFGPGTQSAVEAFHAERFGAQRSHVHTDTWTELGIPDTLVDTHAGETAELPGAVALEVTLTDDASVVPVAEPDDPPAEPDPDPDADDADADDVQAWLAKQLGEPDATVAEPGQGGWPLMSCNERRFSFRADASFTVGFTDLNGYEATGTVADCNDAPHLAGWHVTDEGPPWFAPGHCETHLMLIELRLTTQAEIGLRSTAGDLRAAEPGVTFGEWDVDGYAPAVFQTPSGMRKRVAWDPVADVRRVLNERGVDLAADGTFGPRTEAALAEFQSANGVDESGLGPVTLDALGVAVPNDAPIVYLSAGRWDWDF